jgi:hypothetical protein
MVGPSDLYQFAAGGSGGDCSTPGKLGRSACQARPNQSDDGSDERHEDNDEQRDRQRPQQRAMSRLRTMRLAIDGMYGRVHGCVAFVVSG